MGLYLLLNMDYGSVGWVNIMEVWAILFNALQQYCTFAYLLMVFFVKHILMCFDTVTVGVCVLKNEYVYHFYFCVYDMINK